ncbi:carbohydrate ABC transporter permease [Evansella clarkii]|jgi:raffinose/stachyose/melibiose transport system permease protein|uniref:carbohydrate ABC transporter permease n=1 Tax=Evansella clarkii TaxID=79879 RepID=UPI000996587A|nr:carbohydrate ABC transporter permease [Evansella clarkii]
MVKGKKDKLLDIFIYLFLIIAAFIVIYPLFVMVSTSLKTNMEVLVNPFGLPTEFNLDGYRYVLEVAGFPTFFRNSIIITAVSLFVLLLVSVMASYPLSRFTFRGNRMIYFYFIIGAMLPARLATVNMYQIINALGLFDTLFALILIYIAMTIPISIFIIAGFMAELPRELDESARIDGASDSRILFSIWVPLLRPALATVAIFNFIPIWNEFFFPLIFISSDQWKPLPLGIAQFFGQYQSDWPTAFAALTIAILPPLIFYLMASKHFIKGLTAGALKG